MFLDVFLPSLNGFDVLDRLRSRGIPVIVMSVIPEAEIVTRPRFSTLSYVGSKKIQRLPPRSAIVAFTAQDVYAIAELIRRQRGGAAVRILVGTVSNCHGALGVLRVGGSPVARTE